MPVEIKELNIKVNVDANAPPSGGANAANNASLPPQPDPTLVEACVEKVLEVLQQKKER